jgi:hypothetical protein
MVYKFRIKGSGSHVKKKIKRGRNPGVERIALSEALNLEPF